MGLLPPTAASAPSPASRGVDRLGADARHRRRPLGEPGGRDHVRRCVDELAGGVGPARDERGAVGHGRELARRAADHEALDAARRLAAPPAAGRRSRRSRRLRPARAPAPRRGAAATRRAPTRPCRRRGTRAPPARPRSAARRRRARAPRRRAGRRAAYTIATGSASRRPRAPGRRARDARAPPRRRRRSAPTRTGRPRSPRHASCDNNDSLIGSVRLEFRLLHSNQEAL